VRLTLAELFGVAPERVRLGAGSTELIDATMRTFLRAGDEVVLPHSHGPCSSGA
jgi:histidinol-phosphate/aromatic aminotransferase/cobyric acid decarboxylase-like protein